jgi:hypothetical protein
MSCSCLGWSVAGVLLGPDDVLADIAIQCRCFIPSGAHLFDEVGSFLLFRGALRAVREHL